MFKRKRYSIFYSSKRKNNTGFSYAGVRRGKKVIRAYAFGSGRGRLKRVI